jgi:hypothetical protein
MFPNIRQLQKYLQGNWLLFKSFLCELPRLHQIPLLIRDPDALALRFESAAKSGKLEPFEISTDISLVQSYNIRMETLKSNLKTLEIVEPPFEVTRLWFVLVRLITLFVVAWLGDVRCTVAVSLLQFLVAPYSFFVSFAMLCALTPPIFAGHYLTFTLLNFAVDTLLPAWLAESVSFVWSPWLIAAFFIVDQLQCVYVTFHDTTVGPPAHVSPAKALRHVLWGFFNAKTYTLIILLHLSFAGFRCNLLVWAADAVLNLSSRVSAWVSGLGLHWGAIFYHQHRLAHLPGVYEHAHKFHHYLYDSTAFDAHLYGSGAPEEWFCLVVETLGALRLGLLPVSLAATPLYLSWTNKVGHTRKQQVQGGVNNHCDHHTFHNKNFGIYNISLDVLLGTQADTGKKMEVGSYILTRVETDNQVRLIYTPAHQNQ